MSHLAEALEEARRTLPGWAWAVLSKALTARETEDLPAAPNLASMWTWAQGRLPLAVAPLGDAHEVRPASDYCQFQTACRWAFDHPMAQGGLIARGTDNRQMVMAKKTGYDAVRQVVPSAGPKGAPIAFVGTNPTALDAARGEPVSGPDGKALHDRYLAPLGLVKAEVLITNALPLAGEPAPEEMARWGGWIERELDLLQPRVVVALGKVAKEVLGDRADFVLPHPATVRKRGDRGEVARKIQQIRKRLTPCAGPAWAVPIVRKDAAKRLVYGVVLDPYQIDSQGDWIPPHEVEQTAHDFVAKSRVIGLHHAGVAKATLVESWLWPYPTPEDYASAMNGEPHRAYEVPFGNQRVHSGAWIIGTRIDDDATWAAVEAGEIGAYSIGGYGARAEIDPTHDMPKVEFIASS